jgi:hypothetical protein
LGLLVVHSLHFVAHDSALFPLLFFYPCIRLHSSRHQPKTLHRPTQPLSFPDETRDRDLPSASSSFLLIYPALHWRSPVRCRKWLCVLPIFSRCIPFLKCSAALLFSIFFSPHEEVDHLRSLWPSYMSFLILSHLIFQCASGEKPLSILSALHLFCKNRLDCRPALRSTLVISVEPLFIM